VIPVSKPYIGDEEVRAVAEVLRSGWLVQGERVARLERMVAEYVGVKRAIAVSSGTAALHLALLALDVEGGEVILPPLTYAATANAIVHAGATPVFADVDSTTYTIDPRSVEAKLTPRTKAILPVHLYGHPAPMDEILEIAERRGLAVLEDAAEALGAEYRGRRVGSLGDAACLSFHPVKTITTGEGGMVLTDDEGLAARLGALRSHGEDTSAWDRERGKASSRRHILIGLNYRMSDVAGAIGVEQMKRIDRFVEARRRNASLLTERISRLKGVKPPYEAPGVKHAYQYYVASLDRAEIRPELMKRLRERGVGCAVHFNCVHLEPAYRERFGTGEGLCPVAESISPRLITLPMFVELTPFEIEMVASSLGDALRL